MSKTKTEVLVLLQFDGGKNRERFDAYLKDEGFDTIEGEADAYMGFSTTPVFNTRAYIFEVFSKAFAIAEIEQCKLICQIGGNEFEGYEYKKDGSFKEIAI
ncbi:MAG: hypothetical protein LBS73_03925 [Campylobacteraceae bacterium]|jgi:hypothetical protein|nr:hypothetical protein [Campylobacteraceae bacterium]